MLWMLHKEAQPFGQGSRKARDVIARKVGLVMRFGQVVFLMTLGMTAATVGEAQTFAAGPVLVASESLPQGVFPELLAGTHSSLLQGLPMAPAISQALPVAPEVDAAHPRLTSKDRITLFWNDTYASPGAFVGVASGALVDQVRHTPAKWDGDGSGYTRRFANEYGQLATRNVIHEGLAAVTGLDPRYPVCKCDGTFKRSGHALKMTFTSYRQDGRLTLDVPQIAGAYVSGMVSTFWYPHDRYNPLVQGVQFGHEQMGEVLLSNLVQEFGPSIEHALHLHAITARSQGPDPDDQ